MDSLINLRAPGSGAHRLLGGHLMRPPLDHTDHTRLSSVEPGDIRPPGCGPYAGGRAYSSYLHLLTYNRQISFMVLTVLKSK